MTKGIVHFFTGGGSGKEEEKKKESSVYCALILAEGTLHSENNKQNQLRIADVETLVWDVRTCNMRELHF